MISKSGFDLVRDLSYINPPVPLSFCVIVFEDIFLSFIDFILEKPSKYDIEFILQKSKILIPLFQQMMKLAQQFTHDFGRNLTSGVCL